MQNTTDEIKRSIDLLDYIQRVTARKAEKITANEYRINPCPICGHKDHFTIYRDTQSYCSFNECCKGGTVIDFEMEYYKKDKSEAIKTLEEVAKINPPLNWESNKEPVKKVKEEEPEPKQNYSSLITEWSKKAGETDYFTKRGLSESIINKYRLGYNSEGYQKHGKTFKYMIPVSETFVILREEGTENGRYRNLGNAELLNVNYIADADIKEIFIVEGAFDAFSIEQEGFYSIALNSTSNYKKLIELISENKKTAQEKEFIFIPDNDEQGQKFKDKLMDEFSNIGIPLTVKEIPQDKGKDSNDYLRADKSGFNSFLNGAVENTKNYVSGYLDSFFNYIMDDSQKEKPIDTGFPAINKKLGGGLYSGLYAIGGISSLGKTSIVLQMADYIAKNGTDVIIFSLEMGKRELMARSISREIFECARDKKEARGIGTREVLNGQLKDVWHLFEEAKLQYRASAKNLIIHEGNFETGIDEIKEIIKRHIGRTGKKPVVILDYLQILKGKERFTDKQNADYLVSELKRMSRTFTIPVMAISSFNRANYSTPVSYESFKESGGIEYGADVLMGLQLGIVKELDQKESNKTANRAKIDQAKKETPRKIDLVILKNRNGEPNDLQEFEFYAKNNYFRQV